MGRGSMQFLEVVQGAAVSETLTAWKQDHPKLGVLALVAEDGCDLTIATLQDHCSRAGVPLLGAVFPQLLCQGRFRPRGALLLRLDTMPFARTYGPLQATEQSTLEVVERLTADVVARLDTPRRSSLFLVFDALVANVATILDEIYVRLADGVHYLGVSAGSETFRALPCLFDGGARMENGVLAILLPDHPGAVAEHCYQAKDGMVSATDGNRIISIDWRPSFEVYRELVKERFGVALDRENFYRYAVHFPFGIMRASGEVVVRIPVALEADGSLRCIGEVPHNALLSLLRAPEGGSADTVDALSRGLRDLHGSLSGASLLAFYCAGRRQHLGELAQGELAELGRRTDAGQIGGALSLGEIGQTRQWGYPLFHNGAILCSRWSGP